VGIDVETTQEMIIEPIEAEETVEIDPLSILNLRKIAVVTLNERAAKQAAEELKSRTGAEVVIVTSTTADDLTKTAESADLILFVWAASTHAVYRTFDHVRDKLQYVQGTGPSSIVLAAERWALQSV
jgi:vacuolar-type H+-ATPase subunit F/Vma7